MTCIALPLSTDIVIPTQKTTNWESQICPWWNHSGQFESPLCPPSTLATNVLELMFTKPNIMLLKRLFSTYDMFIWSPKSSTSKAKWFLCKWNIKAGKSFHYLAITSTHQDSFWMQPVDIPLSSFQLAMSGAPLNFTDQSNHNSRVHS